MASTERLQELSSLETLDENEMVEYIALSLECDDKTAKELFREFVRSRMLEPITYH